MSGDPGYGGGVQDDGRWMRLAIELAHRSPRSDAAFAVGAVIVDAEGREIARGWSRDVDGQVHAEESALSRVAPDDPRLSGATLYSTLEPCGRRASRPRTCAELIVASGIRRVVFAWREPDVFVTGAQGIAVLAAAGIEVVEMPELAEAAQEPNLHVLPPV
ncbi:diaminohydroxyphosphoribosylaminopyrimidine deaminase [Pseudonocardia thermophila]|uniref:Diaminohydroxyphosphoribosylaminopyrimidine deaminase n=1 Tax=Pseudonocardia thermophila TaxID=1848 RepID=A0A1M6ZMM7_PSETH|nr:deaminase [Pseudonocardia thermophila]SHL31619.1 diaminohydroxyphosphoribosylaminopyrimidine deaminase [Pseudonocardia thermophila]